MYVYIYIYVYILHIQVFVRFYLERNTVCLPDVMCAYLMLRYVT